MNHAHRTACNSKLKECIAPALRYVSSSQRNLEGRRLQIQILPTAKNNTDNTCHRIFPSISRSHMKSRWATASDSSFDSRLSVASQCSVHQSRVLWRRCACHRTTPSFVQFLRVETVNGIVKSPLSKIDSEFPPENRRGAIRHLSAPVPCILCAARLNSATEDMKMTKL
jgi:hypothetical protein